MPHQPHTLALDCATITGYALWLSHGELVSGIIDVSRAPQKGPGYSMIRLDHELEERFAEYADEGMHVVIERPGFFKNVEPTILVGGLCWHAREWARSHRCHVTHYSPATIKKFAVGHGFAKKEQMLRAARQKWHTESIVDHNQADALWLLEMVLGGTGSPEDVDIPI